MQIGKPTRCYPFRKETGDFMFIPYDYTEAELKYVGGGRDTLEQIEDFWPQPMLNDSVVQTMILEYEYDNRRTKRV